MFLGICGETNTESCTGYGEQFEQHKLRDRDFNAKLDKMLSNQNNYDKRLGALESNVSEFIDENERVQLFILRATITNEQLPNQERINAYDEYTRRGGNGWVREYWAHELANIQARMVKRLAGCSGNGRRMPGEEST